VSARPTASVTLRMASMDVDRPRDADQNSEADWSWIRTQTTPSSEEQDPNGGPCNMDCDDLVRRYDALTYLELTRVLDRQILPSDDHERRAFDIRGRFELGDPHVHYHAPAANEYEISGACGCPDWPALFSYVLNHCRGLEHADTVYILVDNRNLTSETTTEESLAHWPTVAAWWKSRMLLTGPAQEQCDIVFFPISLASGLQNVHPVGRAHLSLLHCALSSPGSILSSLTMTAFPSLCSKSETFGEKLISQEFKACPVGDPVSVPGTQARTLLLLTAVMSQNQIKVFC